MNEEIFDSRLIDAKADAHSLVEELVQLGFRKSDVYNRLRRELHLIEGKEHFNNMYNLKEVWAAKQFLYNLRKLRLEYLGLSSPKPRV